MIRYNLKCEAEHSFDSWFQSADAFETLRKAGHVACTVCGSTQVSKALMAPPVAKKGKGALSRAESAAEQKLRDMRKHVEENSTYVGGKFAEKARAMHDGTAPEQSIWGEANAKEAKALIEEGVPVAPLPFMPKQKAN